MRYQHCGGLLLLIQHLCVYLRCRKVAVSEQLADCVYVNAEVEHHNCECMPSAVECYMFVDAGKAAPCA